MLFSLKINSDEITPAVEMFFGTEQASGDAITFNLSNNQGQVWGGINSVDCNFSWYTTSLFNSPSYTVTTHNQPVGSWAGLDFTTSPGNYQIFGYGLYKVTNSESSSYFFIDYRDQRVGCTPYGNNGHPIDV